MMFDFFDYNLLKDIVGALIGTLTALAIYFLTIRQDRIKEKNNDKKINKNKIIYLNSIIQSFINQINNLNNSLICLTDEFEKDPLKFHLPSIKVDESAIILNEILKSEEMFSAYTELFEKEKIKNFNNIRNEVAFLLAQNHQIKDMSIRANNFDFERKKSMSEMIDNIMEILIRIYDISDDIIPNSFKQSIFDFSKEFQLNLDDRTDVKYYNDYYLTPLMTMLVNYSKNEFVFQIISMIKKAKILYEHIEQNNKQHLNHLKKIQSTIEELQIKVIKDTSHIKI